MAETRRLHRKAEHLEKLRQALHNKDLVLIAGAGVSQSAIPSLPILSWTGLLEDGLDYLQDEGLIGAADKDLAHYREVLKQSNLEARQLLRVCQYLKDELDHHKNFPTWLSSVFSSLHEKVTNPEVFKPILELHKKGSRLMTTNYNELLEHFCQLQRVRRGLPDDVRKY